MSIKQPRMMKSTVIAALHDIAQVRAHFPQTLLIAREMVAFGDTRTVPRWVLLVTGVASLVVAFFAIFSPGIAAEAITWVLGAWLLARGVLEVIVALVDRSGSARWVTLLNALVDVLLGTLLMSNPGGAAVGVAFTVLAG